MMKTTLYYFTGTGNTLAAAHALGERLGKTELKPIMPELNKRTIQLTGELIGICFPLYFLSFPKPVMDFLERAEIPAGSSVFALITRGLAPMGGVYSPLRKILKKKGTRLSGLFYITMPNNDMTLFDADAPQTIKKKLASVSVHVERIAQVLEIGRRHYDFEPFAWARAFRHQPAYLNHLKEFGRNFRADDKCTGCGICARICPMDNIALEVKKPAWGDACVLCEGCLNWCPARAVQYRKITIQKGRYRHRDVSVADMEAQKKQH